jgi:RNA polymerase sigma-70 factor, ECF subfamily
MGDVGAQAAQEIVTGHPGGVAPDDRWIHPIPDERVIPENAAVRSETIRLAFVAALQHLPPRQRAVLILRDVLCWSAEEVAGLLESTVASVNSALQRSRATMRANAPAPAEPWRPDDAVQRDLLDRYCAAFERHDVATLVSLLHEDATTSMPPFAWWLRGRADIAAVMSAPQASCEGARLVLVRANGQPAFWQTRPGPGGAHEPFALMVFDVRAGAVTGIVTYLGADRWTPMFPV